MQMKKYNLLKEFVGLFKIKAIYKLNMTENSSKNNLQHSHH